MRISLRTGRLLDLFKNPISANIRVANCRLDGARQTTEIAKAVPRPNNIEPDSCFFC